MKTINPVLVGVGQYVQRKPSEDQLASTIDLAAKASQRALEDAGAAVDLSGTVDTIEEDGRRLSIRNRSQGVCGKVFQSVGVVMPPAMQGA
jgi:hypothetical protein